MRTSKPPSTARIASKYRNAGQTCVCANRIYVQSGIYDRFAERLAEKVSAMKVGNGLDQGTTVGPLIEDKAVAKVEEHVRDAVSKGAKVRGRWQARRGRRGTSTCPPC